MKILLFALMPLLLASCMQNDKSTSHINTDETLLVLHDFDNGIISSDIKLSAAKGDIVNQALNIKFRSGKHAYSSFQLKPDSKYDWSQYDDFNIAFDISNEGEHSVQLYLDISDAKGANYTRSVNIPVGPQKTYYAKITGHDLATPEGRGDIELNFLSGLRNNPPTWESNDVQFISLWGKKNIDTKAITRVGFSIQSALFDKEITVDNIRLRKNPPQNKQFLNGIVDQFGQNNKVDYPGKIHSEKQLLSEKKKEDKQLTGELLNDRSKFGGWKNGPKQKGTGYFRTAKVNGKWALIDPEGYPYFATGLDIIRLGDAATLTGYDYKTREDKSTRYVELQPRVDMFSWLPELDEPLAKHYAYMPYTHSGALAKGEAFNFQRANLERKYGDGYEQKWLDVTVKRMMNWGFTSLGNWTSPKLYDNNKVPYFANGWINGDFKKVSSGADFWGALPDVFDPAFAERADTVAKQISVEVNGSPWCVGVFVDNEKSFGRPNNKSSLYGIVINTLTRDGKDVPTKAHFTKMMKKRYGNINTLNTAWEKDIPSWDAFEKSVESSLTTPAQEKDYGDLLSAYAEEYFKIVNVALKKYMPNHLYVGARFPDWGMPIEVVKASAKHVDVISFNAYKEGLLKKKWAFMKELDMPAIIGEFHMGAMDRGMFHSGIIIASDQEDRAKMFKDYMHSVIDHPNFVGAHYFQYADGPLTGRGYDGENYNIGFISVTDTPYKEMVEAAKDINSELYTRRFSK